MRRWTWFARPHVKAQQQEPERPPEPARRENLPAWNSPTIILDRPLLTRGQEYRANRGRDRNWDRR